MASVTQCDHCKKIKEEWDLTWISVVFTLQGRGKKNCRHNDEYMQQYIDACSSSCLEAHIKMKTKEFINDSK